MFGLDRPQTFPESIEQGGIVFRNYHLTYKTKEQASNEAYFQRKKGNYARIISRKSKLTGETLYAVFLARKQ